MLKNKILFIALLLATSVFADGAQKLINQNGCLACHAVASKKAAPAFTDIAMRNKRFEGANAKNTIMNSIKKGSHGKYPYFSNAVMPPFSNLSDEQLSTIANYIMAQSSKVQCRGMR